MHSQNAEERYILAAFAGQAHPGRFLDIGAWNAVDKSNTRALYERGWSGVLIEPSPGPFAGLQAAYRNEPRITLLQAAVGFERHPLKMWVTDDAVTTSDSATYQKWRRHVKYNGEITVQQLLIEDVYEHGEFDFVSIDAEGVSVDLMQRILALKHYPRCMCVEHDDRTSEIISGVTPLGYHIVYGNGENLVMVRG